MVQPKRYLHFRFKKSGNTKAKELFENSYWMPAFPQLTKSDIDAIYDYLDSLPFDEKEYKHRK